LQAIDNFQGNFLNRVEEEKTPLLMVAENNTVDLTNKKSILAYNLQLYDENNLPIGENYTVDGVNKKLLTWSNVVNLLNGNIDLFQPTNVQFPVPITVPLNNQVYNLKADRWTGDAKWRNGANIASAFIGLISTGAAEIFTNAGCAINLGNFFFTNATLIIQQLTNGQLNASQATGAFISIITTKSSQLFDIIRDCQGNYSIGSEAFQNLLKKLSFVGNLENGALLIFNIADMAQYDSEIEFCFERTGAEIVECNEIDIIGCWAIQFNSSSGNCNYTLNFLLNEDNSVSVVNSACIESNPIANDNATIRSYSLNENSFSFDFGYDYGGTVEIITINGTYQESTDTITGNFSQSTTQNGNTNNCAGNITMGRI
jgi:hypothetical protein